MGQESGESFDLAWLRGWESGEECDGSGEKCVGPLQQSIFPFSVLHDSVLAWHGSYQP